MESATERNPDSELNVALLHSPQHIQTQVSKDKSRDKSSVFLFKSNQKLIKERNQGSGIASVSLDNIPKNSAINTNLHLNDPEDGSEGEDDTDKKFEPWNDRIGAFVFQFDLKNGDFFLDGVVLGFELSHFFRESSVGFPLWQKSSFLVFVVVVVLLFQFISFFVQGFDCSGEGVSGFSHFSASPGFGSSPEVIDHIDWEGEQSNSTKKNDKNPSKEWENGHDVNSERGFEFELFVAFDGVSDGDGLGAVDFVFREIESNFSVRDADPLEDGPTDEDKHDGDNNGTNGVAEGSTESFFHGIILISFI